MQLQVHSLCHFTCGYACTPPRDICHLLDLMIRDPEAYELFHVHDYLLPVIAYSGMFKGLYDFTRFVLSKKQFRDVLFALPEDYICDSTDNVPNWVQLVKCNSVLQTTLNFNQGNQN